MESPHEVHDTLEDVYQMRGSGKMRIFALSHPRERGENIFTIETWGDKMGIPYVGPDSNLDKTEAAKKKKWTGSDFNNQKFLRRVSLFWSSPSFLFLAFFHVRTATHSSLARKKSQWTGCKKCMLTRFCFFTSGNAPCFSLFYPRVSWNGILVGGLGGNLLRWMRILVFETVAWVAFSPYVQL